jgi:hypothetical protein
MRALCSACSHARVELTSAGVPQFFCEERGHAQRDLLQGAVFRQCSQNARTLRGRVSPSARALHHGMRDVFGRVGRPSLDGFERDHAEQIMKWPCSRSSITDARPESAVSVSR